MTTQVQVRGAASGTQNIRTLVSRELDVDTTNKRLCVHDGTTVGGIPHVNYSDQQKNTFSYGVVSGTNALTLSLAIAPLSLVSPLEVVFKVVNNNTGSVTLNVNSLGAVTIKKARGGSLVDLDADDLVQNAIYRAVYNGTYWVLIVGGGSGEILVASTDISGSPSTVDFTSVFRLGYNYRIEFTDVLPTTDIQQFRCRLHNGTSFLTTGYKNGYRVDISGGLATIANTSIDLLQTVGNGSNEGLGGEMLIKNPVNSASYTRVGSKIDYVTGSGEPEQAEAWGIHTTPAATTGIQFYFGSGTLASGNIAIYEKPVGG